eukprot:Tbor_TRINITY_DN5589_c1_g1::TRINITY_DN5589_c1_g1_i3::g.12999::m.12999/K16365/SGTA; small glutamine-rich tetratricopeptide repeat-containing protein alpha
MSTSDPAPADITRDITDVDKKLAFSFLRYMQKLKIDKDKSEAVLHLLSEAFDIDAAGIGGKYDAELDIYDVFSTAVDGAGGSEDKFKAFLDLLEKKGYFKDATPGSEMYEERVKKARAKFAQRNNPFEGMSVDELKSKGNELMGQSKYKDAIAHYTKGIEMDPKNHILYANRAAAYLHLNDYKTAVMDCEKAIVINDTYAKAYGRMGTAYYYDSKYSQSVQAFTYACKLDPDAYKEDLERAKEKLDQLTKANPADAGGMPGFPGMPPGMDMNTMMKMMENPQFIGTMEKMMSNPAMAAMAQNMSREMFANGGNMPMQGGMPPKVVDADGNFVSPFGKINRNKIDALRAKHMGNEKMKQIMDSVEKDGMSAFFKHMGDPEVMSMMMEFSSDMMTGVDQDDQPAVLEQ